MDGKVKMQGMTLVEVVVATALFAIFLCLSLGLWQMAVGHRRQLQQRLEAERNLEQMVDFMKEEIGLAQSVCIFVDTDGNLGTVGSQDIRHPRHNQDELAQIPTTPMKLERLVFEYNTEKEKILYANHGEMTFQSQQVGDRLGCVWVVCDETGRLVTFAVEEAPQERESTPMQIRWTEDMGYKK
ncbi:MAG: PulJ/GspJ family protein [Cellulosilyticaceae bacterium]